LSAVMSKLARGVFGVRRDHQIIPGANYGTVWN
jgi:hypothetical protein